VKIVVLVEGKTERACKPVLKAFLDEVAEAESKQPVGLATRQYGGSRIWDVERVTRDACGYLRQSDVAGVALLLDVFPQFQSATAATEGYVTRLRDARFRAHCALHDFEAWLLPHWQRVYRLASRAAPRQCPWPSPEGVDLVKPPGRVLSELFAPTRGYERTRDAPRILQSPDDLRLSAAKCPQLRSFLNTLLEFAGYETHL